MRTTYPDARVGVVDYKKDKNSAVSALLAVKLYIVGKGAAENCETKILYKHLTKEKFFAIISISLF